jgi:multiple sugar transport system permease protein
MTAVRRQYVQPPLKWGRILLHTGLILGGLVMLLPFFWMVSTSLKTPREVFTYPPVLIPSQFEWANYARAWESMPFDRFYFNSIVVAVSVTFLQLLTSSLAAYAFARLRFKGRNTLFVIYLATLMIPFPVLLIPNFIIVRLLGWYDTYQALIIPPAFSAFSTFLLRQHFLSIPVEFDDAARIDGANSFYIWWYILLPMSKTTLAALSIFIFLGNWNEFLWPLVVTSSEEMRTIPVGLNSFRGQFNVKWELLMAAAVVAMLPVLIIYVFAQKWFIKGITISGLGGR